METPKWGFPLASMFFPRNSVNWNISMYTEKRGVFFINKHFYVKEFYIESIIKNSIISKRK